MCDIMENLMNKRSKNDRIECAGRLLALRKLSNEEISKVMHLPLSTIEELTAEQKKSV